MRGVIIVASECSSELLGELRGRAIFIKKVEIFVFVRFKEIGENLHAISTYYLFDILEARE